VLTSVAGAVTYCKCIPSGMAVFKMGMTLLAALFTTGTRFERQVME
jgi:hypothetical protein